jgi:hypothetical protein
MYTEPKNLGDPRQGKETYLGRSEGKDPPSACPPCGLTESASALLYLNCSNSDEVQKIIGDDSSKRKAWTPKSQTAKKQKTLTGNVQYWANKLGVENLGFLTLTFKENMRDKKEAQRRWNNLNRTISRDGKFTVLVKVLEVQRRGAFHYHLLVKIGEDIRTGFDWVAFKKAAEAYNAKDKEEGKRQTKIYATSATDHLRHLWGYMRAKCKSHGFGRSELMPIEYPNNIGSYLGKYLNKDDQERENGTWANVELTKGMRRVSYGRKEIKTHSAKFSWVAHPRSNPLFRHRLKEWAEYRGFTSMEHIKEHLGKHWTHHYFQEIMFDYPRMEREREGLPPISASGKPSGSGEPNWHYVTDEEWKEFFKRDTVTRSNFQLEKRRKEAFEYKQKFPWKFDTG